MKCLFQRSFFMLDFVKDRFVFALIACMSFICVQPIFFSDAGSVGTDDSLITVGLSSISSGGYRSDGSSASLDSGGSLGGAGGPGKRAYGFVKPQSDDATLRKILKNKLASDFSEENAVWFDDEMPFGIGNEYQELRITAHPKHRDNSKVAVFTQVSDNVDAGRQVCDIYIYSLDLFPHKGTEEYRRFMERRLMRECAFYDESKKDGEGLIDGKPLLRAVNWVGLSITPYTTIHIPSHSNYAALLADDFIPRLFKRKSTATVVGKLREARVEGLSEQLVADAACALICYTLFEGAVFIPFAHDTFLPERILDAGLLLLISKALFKKERVAQISKDLPDFSAHQTAAMSRVICLWFIYNRIDKGAAIRLLQFLRDDRGSREAERLLVLFNSDVKSDHITSEWDLKKRVEDAFAESEVVYGESGGVQLYIDALSEVRRGIDTSSSKLMFLAELCKMAYANRKVAPYPAIALLDIVGSYIEPTIDEALYIINLMYTEVSKRKDDGLLFDIDRCRVHISENKKRYDAQCAALRGKIKSINTELAHEAVGREEYEEYALRRSASVRRVDLDDSGMSDLRKPLLDCDTRGSIDGRSLSCDSTSLGDFSDRGFGSVGSTSGSSADH